MELFEGESFPRSATRIDQAGVIEQDNNLLEEDIDKRNTHKLSFLRVRNGFFCLVENGGHIDHRLKKINFILILHFLRRCFEFDNTHIICN